MKHRKPKVLFVCVHNSCRSQMAAGFYASFAGPENAFSAGTEPEEEVDPMAVEVMKEVGVDISAKRPVRLTGALIKKTDRAVIVCAGGSCPNIPNAQHWEVADPRGGGLDDYRWCRDLIKNRVERLDIQIGKRPQKLNQFI